MASKIKFTLISNVKSGNQFFLNWWAHQTHHKHLLPRTAAFFRNNLVAAIKVSVKRKVVAAAGLVPSVTSDGELINFEGNPVVEFCSNFVSERYRGKNIARRMIQMRMDFCRQNSLIAIVVTKEPKISKIISDLGWHEMAKYRRYDKIRQLIRNCTCEKNDHTFTGERCDVCPFLGRSIWVFNPNN